MDNHSTANGFWQCGKYQVTWTFGHLCELKEPHEYAPRWKRWDMWDLPIIPPRFGIRLKEDEGIKKQFAVIEKLMKAAEGIINCGDAGQEGELIQRWVMQKAGAKCPVKRLWISSLTEEAIREGFNTLKDQSEYESLYMAGTVMTASVYGRSLSRNRRLDIGHECNSLIYNEIRTESSAPQHRSRTNSDIGIDSESPGRDREFRTKAELGALYSLSLC